MLLYLLYVVSTCEEALVQLAQSALADCHSIAVRLSTALVLVPLHMLPVMASNIKAHIGKLFLHSSTSFSHIKDDLVTFCASNDPYTSIRAMCTMNAQIFMYTFSAVSARKHTHTQL